MNLGRAVSLSPAWRVFTPWFGQAGLAGVLTQPFESGQVAVARHAHVQIGAAMGGASQDGATAQRMPRREASGDPEYPADYSGAA